MSVDDVSGRDPRLTIQARRLPAGGFPRQRVMRLAAAAWLAAAVAMLAALLIDPDFQAGDRSALSVLVPLYFISLPLGHVGLLAANYAKLVLYLDYQFVPGVMAEGLLLWLALTVLGYLQWFVVVPWIARASARVARFLFNRDAAG